MPTQSQIDAEIRRMMVEDEKDAEVLRKFIPAHNDILHYTKPHIGQVAFIGEGADQASLHGIAAHNAVSIMRKCKPHLQTQFMGKISLDDPIKKQRTELRKLLRAEVKCGDMCEPTDDDETEIDEDA